MSKSKSKQTDQLRYSGPELSELLDRVVVELGSTAAISAVNRVRSGGIGGFFCKEEFEVIVDRSAESRSAGRSDIQSSAGRSNTAQQPSPSTPPPSAILGGDARAPTAAPSALTAPDPAAVFNPAASSNPAAVFNPPVTVDPAAGLNLAAVVDPTAMPNPAVPADPMDSTMPVGSAMATDPAVPADGVAVDPGSEPAIRPPTHPAAPVVEPAPPAQQPAAGPTGEVFGGPRPVSPGGTDAAFLALLERRLDEASAAESPLAARRNPAANQESTAETEQPSPIPEPVAPAPGLALPADDPYDGPAAGPGPSSFPTGPSSGFWLRLQEAEEELAGFMPAPSSFVATIGPLSLITPIVRRLRAQPRFSSADVVVLTNRTEIVSEPQWQLVRSGNQLVEEANQRGDRPTLLLIDVPVELPNWVAPLQNRLRMAGVGLFRYAIPGHPDAAKLDQYRLGSDVPYVLDLISRVPPRSLVDFLDQRHPIASVSGADITAELLLALRRQVAPDRQSHDRQSSLSERVGLG